MLGVELAPTPLGGFDLAEPLPDRRTFAMWNESLAIRGPFWKLLLADRPVSLFHIADDPYETRDLLGSRPEIAKELARYAAALPEVARVHRQNRRVVERLRALGYVQ